ncbi:MAG TPA: hypothetical protein EYN91_17440 [Candidatus Melainabacteria bacterium]|mgnify:CR=1 FL=1|jgi:hypothetical protein|nr:hypothetical protein [Candidatus Melainabacteria bacterium]HIN66331.1 hypothetical protein [Candidatus Obscuribacterales bacterium]
MRISKKLAGAASLIAIASAFTFVQPSHANDLVDFFQNTLGVNVTNLRNPQSFARTHFQSKRSQIEANISFALSSGRINASQAAALRAELAGLNNLQIAYEADGYLSVSEARTLSDRFTNLDNRVDRFVATAPGGWGNRYDDRFGGKFGGRFGDRRFMSAVTSVRSEINTLKNRVENGRIQRRLSINEYNLFKDRLADQERKLEKMARSNNRFDQREFDKMNDNLRKLDSLIASAIRTPNYPTAYGQGFGGGYRNWN